ncbi:MAG: hypothetical protein CL940_06735 [Deltaproteobacteria bacterium]|nr:hypothetical protein [Deltaproteobacteria bacterium]
MGGTWKFVLLVACLSGSVGLGHAAVPEPQETPASAEVQSGAGPVEMTPSVEAPSKAEEEAGSFVEVTFKQGRIMRGRLLSLSDTQAVVDTFSGLRLTLQLSQIKRFAEKRLEEFGEVLVQGEYESVRGVLVRYDQAKVVVRMGDGKERALQRSRVVKVSLAAEAQTASVPVAPVRYRELRGPLPPRSEIIPSHRTRYLYAPTAMPLRRGEGYFSQKELIFSAAAFGVTDQMSVLVGSILPAMLFGGPNGANGIFALKYAWKLADETHLALATEALVIPDGGAIGLAGGVVTFGGYHDHISLLASVPYSMSGDAVQSGAFLFTLAGALRTGRRWALLTENWVVGLGEGDPLVIGSIGLRRFGVDHAFDLALFGFSGVGFGLPWVDWTFSWGQRDVDGKRVGAQVPSAPPMAAPSSYANWQRRRAEIGLR